jgi:hypothetical protein
MTALLMQCKSYFCSLFLFPDDSGSGVSAEI